MLKPSMIVDSNNVNGNCGNCVSKERGKKLAKILQKHYTAFNDHASKQLCPNLRGYSYVLLPIFYKYI